jgi:hypothetical protein
MACFPALGALAFVLMHRQLPHDFSSCRTRSRRTRASGRREADADLHAAIAPFIHPPPLFSRSRPPAVSGCSRGILASCSCFRRVCWFPDSTPKTLILFLILHEVIDNWMEYSLYYELPFASLKLHFLPFDFTQVNLDLNVRMVEQVSYFFFFSLWLCL